MRYRGHIENGTVVLDEPAGLPDGTKVTVERADPTEPKSDRMPLRGTPYRFDEPQKPAVPDDAWGSDLDCGCLGT